MILALLPGYESLFGRSDHVYEDYMDDAPSELVMTTLIAINVELNAPDTGNANQKRIFELLTASFTSEQLRKTVGGYFAFAKAQGTKYEGYIFGRRYLMAMFMKEVKRNKQVPPQYVVANFEYKLLMAYLLTVDEVNRQDPGYFPTEAEMSAYGLYAIIWPPLIHQYQFNEQTDFSYEFFKVQCFLAFALKTYRPYLKEFLHALSYKTIGQYLFSFYQVGMATAHYDKDSLFSKFVYIVPDHKVYDYHLQGQTINELLGKANITLPDIKKRPLFQDSKGRYLIIDQDIYLKKLYKGTYFELRTQTSLRRLSYEKYSSTIASKVLEEKVFRSIILGLFGGNSDLVYFDDGTEYAPDAYVRLGSTIFLFEFKGYLFPDEIPEKPSIKTIVEYIDERFISNKEGAAKGITQLSAQMKRLKDRKHQFDQKLNILANTEAIIIYPIICSDEFYFTIPGINEYLNLRLQQQIVGLSNNNIFIQQLTLVPLNILYQMYLRGSDFQMLQSFLERYWAYIAEAMIDSRNNFTTKNFMESKKSFDEFFDQHLRTVFADHEPDQDKHLNILKAAGVTQQILDEEV